MPTGYREIAAALRDAIQRGEYPAGARIPTEHELAERYGVARETVRRALATLKSAGVLRAATSQGTIVAPPPVRLPVTRYAAVADPDREHNQLGPWETACAQQGVEGRAEIVRVVRAPASAELARRLGVADGSPLVCRERRMWAGADLAQIQESWLPAALIEGTPLADGAKLVGGLYAALARIGLTVAEFSEEVLARTPTEAEQQLFDMPGAVPVLEMWRVTRDDSARAVEVLRTVADSRRSSLVYDNLPVVPR